MRILLALLVVAALSLSARAQGLVQIILDGEIDPAGGARVEVDVTFRTPLAERATTMSLGVLLGERTTAVDVAALVSRRLEQAGARVIFTGSTAPGRGPASVFVEDVTSIGLRLGRGLSASITLCEDRPASLRLSPGLESKSGATLLVSAQTYEAQARLPGRLSYDIAFEDKADAADAASKLVKTALDKGWFSEVEAHEVWRPGATTEGASIVGFSVHLRSNADWRIDVTLAQRSGQR